jgi:phosphohistidine phosphatase
MMIYVVRHAWAGQSGDPAYPNDDERPLTDKGRKRFKKLIKKLVKRGFNPIAVATSPLVRTEQTAAVLSEVCPARPPLSVLPALAPGSHLQSLLDWTSSQAPSDVAWVGHAPDVEMLTGALIGDSACQIRFDKGAVAAVQFMGDVAAGAGELVWLANAELMRC